MITLPQAKELFIPQNPCEACPRSKPFKLHDSEAAFACAGKICEKLCTAKPDGENNFTYETFIQDIFRHKSNGGSPNNLFASSEVRGRTSAIISHGYLHDS